MTVVSMNYQDSLHLDVEQLKSLYDQLGTTRAEELICRGFERLSVHVLELDELRIDADIADYERIIHSLISESLDIGLCELAELGVNVLDCRQAGDFNATAATLTRLKRVSGPFLSSDPLASAMII